ncbi:MAG: DUF2868 domain-containing protein [Gloeobacteraceae cyanobacterium ES-bin-144]|nr:DUF2868 domain-containing protein [Verrucomicrobiales bacterium]
MAQDVKRWTLADVIDLESEIVASKKTPPQIRDAVLSSSRGLDGAMARRVGLRIWLDGMRSTSAGAKFLSATALVGTASGALMFAAGIFGVLGVVDHEKTGLHIVLFLAVLIGGQWFILLLAGIAWFFRRRATDGFSSIQAMIGGLIRRFSGERETPWWSRLMHEDGGARAAILWRLGRLAQMIGIFFNLGILAGLTGLVMLKHIGFFWETTTEFAMHSLLEKLTRVLTMPWAAWWPSAVPDAMVIDATRWRPDHATPPGPSVWWEFLLMATIFWGLLPRLVLWLLAWNAGRRALARLDFQARGQRELWRELTGPGRRESNDRALDGVLVLDVGGCGITEESLRPFLLRRLRVNPTAWHSVAVMDAGAEAEAAKALANAPAGVVLLAEGWSLAPARMQTLHSRIRANAHAAPPIKFLIANVGPDHAPTSPSPNERLEWARFVDSLRDPEAEVFFYENSQLGL